MVNWETSREESVAPPLDVSDVRKYFGDEKGFPGIETLVELVAEGVPAPTFKSESNLQKAPENGKHKSVDKDKARV